MRLITKVASAVITTAATTVTGLSVRKWMKEKEENEWTKTQMTKAERMALPDLAKQLPTKHVICIKIKNKTKTDLQNPQIFSYAGQFTGSLPRIVKPGEYKCMAVQKTASYYVKGITGLLTYDIGDTENRLCIYYYNPYFGNNAFGFHWVDSKRVVDSDLYNDVAKGKDRWSTVGTVTWHSKPAKDYELFGFISQGDPAYLHVVVCDK